MTYLNKNHIYYPKLILQKEIVEQNYVNDVCKNCLKNLEDPACITPCKNYLIGLESDLFD